VISILRKKRVACTGYRVETTAEQAETYPMVFTRVDVVHVVEGESLSPTAVHRAVELSALKYCPVSAMLAAGTVEIHHHYRLVSPDGSTSEAECVIRGPNAPAEDLTS
jgi:putative redox protein